MKYTAAVIAGIGITILFFAGVAAMAIQNPVNATLPAGNGHLLVLMGFGVASLLLAAVLWAFGGRGYFATQEPDVHT